MAEKPKDKEKTGPKPDAVKIEGDWEDAVGKALEKRATKRRLAEILKKGA